MARSGKKPRKRSSRKKGTLSWRTRLVLVLGVISVVYLGYLYFLIVSNFEGRRWALPASVYARPMELYEGMPMSSRTI